MRVQGVGNHVILKYIPRRKYAECSDVRDLKPEFENKF